LKKLLLKLVRYLIIMNFWSNTSTDGRNGSTSFNSPQWFNEMRYSLNACQNQNQHTPTVFCDDFAAVGKENFIMDRPYWDQYEDDVNYLQEYVECNNDEYHNVDELAMWERLLYRKRVFNRIKIARQLKQLQCIEDNHRFLKQLIQKQTQLRQFLIEEECERRVRFPSDLVTLCGDLDVPLTEEEEEKESWGHQSLEFLSGSSEKKSMEHSDSKQSDFRQSDFRQSDLRQSDSRRSDTRRSDTRSSQSLEPQQKSRHCRHFLKGHCERGESCGFRHDSSVFCTDMQKVFLGGLPAHLTANLLRHKLAEQGYTVLNYPKILRRFSPQVCLGSVEEAKKLVEKGTIVIDGAVIRVRQFEAFTRDNKKKLPDEVERSVFLGGLAAGTTADMIKDDLGGLGMKVVNVPVVKSGYSPQVALESFAQAQTVLKLMRVQINGTMVNVRPFANIKSSFGKKKKRISA